MNKPLSLETQSQIRALCESIAQRDQLGEDVQEELRGHIEDKVSAYLAGYEELSEADAFLLARGHFGKPATLKNLLQTTHPHQTALHFFRRIAIAIAATLAAQVVAKCVLCAGTLTIIPSLMSQSMLGYAVGITFGRTILDFAVPVFALILLTSLRRPYFVRLRRWLDTSPIHYFGLAMLCVFVFWLSIPVATTEGTIHYSPISNEQNRLFMLLSGISMWIGAFARCLIWIWWCDRSPRTKMGTRTAAIAWGLFEVNLPFIHLFLPWPKLVVEHVGLRLDWILHTPEEWFQMFSPVIVSTYIQVVVVALITGFTYSYVKQTRRRSDIVE
jgi:hypothetical protein